MRILEHFWRLVYWFGQFDPYTVISGLCFILLSSFNIFSYMFVINSVLCMSLLMSNFDFTEQGSVQALALLSCTLEKMTSRWLLYVQQLAAAAKVSYSSDKRVSSKTLLNFNFHFNFFSDKPKSIFSYFGVNSWQCLFSCVNNNS